MYTLKKLCTPYCRDRKKIVNSCRIVFREYNFFSISMQVFLLVLYEIVNLTNKHLIVHLILICSGVELHVFIFFKKEKIAKVFCVFFNILPCSLYR